MGYFKIEKVPGQWKVTIGREMWVYFSTTEMELLHKVMQEWSENQLNQNYGGGE